MYVQFDPSDFLILVPILVYLTYKGYKHMAAIDNLRSAVGSLQTAHGQLYAAVQKHVSNASGMVANAQSSNESAIQDVANQVNQIVVEVQAEIAKIPVQANV